tara:strand:- start:100 stop:279 length:180 start_codon:yes stop_codon:yes gene_type:complete
MYLNSRRLFIGEIASVVCSNRIERVGGDITRGVFAVGDWYIFMKGVVEGGMRVYGYMIG